MKTYLSDVIPKFQRFSDKLDNISLLMSKHWVVLDESSDTRMIYIFREGNQLLISTNGIITKGSWEYLGHNSLMIDHKEQSFLFQMGFFDKNILALKLDSRDEYALLINKDNDANIVYRLTDVHRYLNDSYGNGYSKNVFDGIEHQKALEHVEREKGTAALCENCKHFKFTGIIDMHKGKCMLHSNVTYSNWTCNQFE